MFQEININPVQPSLLRDQLNVFTTAVRPSRPQRIHPVFERNQVQFNASGEVGNNDTRAAKAWSRGSTTSFR